MSDRFPDSRTSLRVVTSPSKPNTMSTATDVGNQGRRRAFRTCSRSCRTR